ncbi:putative Phytocyanin domain, cupredoxin [Helianthus anomalus]
MKRTKMANKNLCIFILIATIVAQVTWVRAEEFIVGDDKGWNFGVDYQAWMAGKDFHHSDTLIFRYEAGKHNVAKLTDQAAFDSCNLEKKEWTLKACGGNTVYIGEGPNFLVSAMGEDCKNGLKILVTGKGPRMRALSENPRKVLGSGRVELINGPVV